MKMICSCIGMVLLLTSQEVRAQNLTNWELCEAIYREYGMRTEACDQDRDSKAKDVEEVEKTTSAPAELSKELKESHIFFTQGGTTLSKDAKDQVNQLASVLDTRPMRRACVKLVGHSDSSGAAELNKKISKLRAEAVAAILKEKMNDGSRIKFVDGVGEAQLLEGFPESSPYHRRVAILARDCG